MLFLLDQRIGGEVRERMLISYLRYKVRMHFTTDGWSEVASYWLT